MANAYGRYGRIRWMVSLARYTLASLLGIVAGVYIAGLLWSVAG